MYKCAIDPLTGAIKSCSATTGVLDYPQRLAIVDDYAYVHSITDVKVYMYSIAADGQFTNPVDSGATGLNSFTRGMAYGYFGDFIGNNVIRCARDRATGKFSACGDSGAGAAFQNPQDIFLGYKGFAYVNNYNNNNPGQGSIARCAVDAAGALSGCTKDVTGLTFPVSLAGF